jgi:hypothetical protein
MSPEEKLAQLGVRRLPQADMDEAPPPPLSMDDYGVAMPALKGTPVKFSPTPFKWRDPSSFPRRQFVYGRHYARKYLSVTAAQTKVGKSFLSLVEAVMFVAVDGFDDQRRARKFIEVGEPAND